MKIFCAYIVIINLVTFIVRGIDKRKSVLKRRRISEKTLLYLSACGGRIGAIFGMGARKHKTIKSAFLKKFYIIVGCWIFLIIMGVIARTKIS